MTPRRQYTVPVDTRLADFCVGELYPPDSPRGFLSQDMILAKVGGFAVDVGWYPEWQPDGHYGVTVYRNGDYTDEIERHETRDPLAVRDLIETWLWRFASGGFLPREEGQRAVSAKIAALAAECRAASQGETPADATAQKSGGGDSPVG